MNQHFAVGNFIRDFIYNDKIEVKGNGLSTRSYMYSSDLSLWLLTLTRKSHANDVYNIGSDFRVSIAQLAQLVNKCGAEVYRELNLPDRTLSVKIIDEKGTGLVSHYIPKIEKSRRHVEIREQTNLRHALKETIKWHKLKSVMEK